MAGQAGNLENRHINLHVISGAFVQQYYHILHEQPDQVHKFYQESSILGRQESNGTMAYVTTLANINEKLMSMDFRNFLTEIETADAQLSHEDGILIAVTGSLTSAEGVCCRFIQSFFLAPQEGGGYFVLNDVFRIISERKPAEINQVGSEGFESSQNGISASEASPALPEPTPADRSVILGHVTAKNIVTERQISNLSVNRTSIENNVGAEPPVQVVKEDPIFPAPTQTNVTKKSYGSIVKDMKESLPTPQVSETILFAKQKPAPKPVSKAAEGPESSAKPTQADESSDGIISQNNSSCNDHSVFIENLPWSVNIETVQEEFKRFGTIKPGGVQVRHCKKKHFVFGFVEYETQQSMQAAIEASPIHMEEKEVCIEAKRSTRGRQSSHMQKEVCIEAKRSPRGGRFQSARTVYHGDNSRGRGGGYVDNANRRNEGEGYNHRNNGDIYNCRNKRSDVDIYNCRSDGDDYSCRNEGENFNRRNDGGNYSRRNDGGENFNRRNGGGENFNRRNNFRNQNEFSGRGRGPPPPWNGYYHNLHPSQPFQSGWSGGVHRFPIFVGTFPVFLCI